MIGFQTLGVVLNMAFNLLALFIGIAVWWKLAEICDLIRYGIRLVRLIDEVKAEVEEPSRKPDGSVRWDPDFRQPTESRHER